MDRLFGQHNGYMRNLLEGFYRLGLPTSVPRVRQAPRLVQAWDQVTQILVAG